MSSLDCGSGGGDTAYEGLRIASLFIIWATGSFGAFFPVIAHRSNKIHLPHAVFESVSSPLCQPYFSPIPNRTAKYFGSGVIIATAFIHLLSPGISELTSPCLGQAWQEYVRTFSDGIRDSHSHRLIRCSLIPWHLLSYRRFAYSLSRSSPSALEQPNSRSLASNMVSWLPTRVYTLHITNTPVLLE